jgi:hypothetical protein
MLCFDYRLESRLESKFQMITLLAHLHSVKGIELDFRFNHFPYNSYCKKQKGKFESVPLSNPNWCRELHQFEPLVTRFSRDMRLKYEERHR